MKKLFTAFFAVVLGVLPMSAQLKSGDDCTSYLANPDFSEGYTTTWSGVNGTTSGKSQLANGWSWNMVVTGWFDSWQDSGFWNIWAGGVTNIEVFQTVSTLPAGTYTLSALLRNTNTADYITDQHIYAKVGENEVIASEEMKKDGFDPSAWQKLELEFETIGDEDVTLGVLGTNDGSNSYGWYQFKDVKLTYNGAVQNDVISKLQESLYSQLEKGSAYFKTDDLKDLEGLKVEYEEAIDGFEDLLMNGDSAEIADAIATAKAALAKAKQGYEDYKTLIVKKNRANNVANAYSDYPGYEDFCEAIDVATETLDDTENNTAKAYADAITALTTATTNFYKSQTFSAENPANYTFLVQHPWFCKDDYEPLNDDDIANLSTSVLDKTGWVNGSSISGSSDVNANLRQARTAFNIWGSGWTGTMDVHQDLTDLPNGFYSISADLITQEGCATTQHAYASASSGITVSPNLESEGWTGNDGTGAGVWTTLSTGKILVSDGKLTIGAASTSDVADGSKGWFCVTNFKLYYYGNDGANDALTQAYAAKLNEIDSLKNEVYYKADKQQVNDVIEVYSGATTAEEINSSLDTINKTIEFAEASIKNYKNITIGITGGKSTYATVTDSLATSSAAYSAANSIVATGLSLFNAKMDDNNATYVTMDSIYANFKEYVVYANEYNKAAAANEEYQDADAKGLLNNIMTEQSAILKAALQTKKDVDTLVVRLQNVEAVALAQNIFGTAQNGADMTGVIVNPDITEYTNVTTAPKGWDCTLTNSGNNNYLNRGQSFDGKGTWYIDAWNGTAGKLLYTASQTLKNLPNGTYSLKAAMRATSAVENADENTHTGVYLFASTGSGNPYFKEKFLHKYYLKTQTEAGQDTAYYVWNQDKYGAIWEEAYNKVNAESYVEGSDPDAESIAAANNGNGYGWEYETISDIIVNNHELTIGVSCDSTFTGHPYTGTWFSADAFRLTLNTLGDNGDWSPANEYATGVVAVAADDEEVKVIGRTIIAPKGAFIITTSGAQVAPNTTVPAGVYVVKTANKVQKILVK